MDEASLEVKVDERATGGRANKRLVEILSEYFKVPKSRISIVSGEKSRDKVVVVALKLTSVHSSETCARLHPNSPIVNRALPACSAPV